MLVDSAGLGAAAAGTSVMGAVEGAALSTGGVSAA